MNNISAYTGDIMQNYFTAYVTAALKNNRVTYYRRYKSHLRTELLFESEDQLASHVYSCTEALRSEECDTLLQPDNIYHPQLAHELRGLQAKDLTILRMRIVYGYAYKVIGSVIGMTEDAVRVRYFRTIQKIRNNMKGDIK